MRSAVVVALCALALLAMPVLAATTPPDALDILWADFCDRHPEHVKCVLATPSTSASPTATPTSTPAASPSPTPTATLAATPTPTPSASPTPTRTASPTPTTTPTSSTPPPPSGFIGPDVASLPTSGAAWSALKAAADASGGTPNLCDQNNRTHPGTTFAAALVYARTGQTAYRDKVIALIKAAVPTQVVGCGNAVLSLGRQLSAYVLAADYVGYRDQTFVAWLSALRTKDIGGHSRWYTLSLTAGDSSNNWGTFALASLTAADAYLRDDAGLVRDWAIFKGYGDASWTFRHTSSYQVAWACPEGYAINPASCTDPKREGANVEDASRTTYPTLGNYPAESAQGHALQALLLQKAGYPAWATNDRQVCRNALWRGRGNNVNYSSADYWVTWATNSHCDLSQPTKPAGFGRGFGYTDWLYGP